MLPTRCQERAWQTEDRRPQLVSLHGVFRPSLERSNLSRIGDEAWHRNHRFHLLDHAGRGVFVRCASASVMEGV